MSLPSSHFDSRLFPAPIALSLWHDQISVIFDSRPRQSVEEGFFASVDAYLVGEVAVGFMRSRAQLFDRSRRKIARDGMDGYILQFYTDGTSEDRQGRHAARPGDLYVLDMAQPIATSVTDHSHLSLIVPRRMLAPLLKAPDECHERVVPAGLPIVALLRDTMASYFQNLVDMPVETAEAVLRPLLDLVAVAISGQVDEEKTASLNFALFASMRRYVEANLLDSDLDAQVVAATFGLSRRSLYRMFESTGGFVHYVQERRLRRAHAALRALETRHVPIATIADKHGFPNPENFSRAFRRLFGMTPREARGLALALSQGPRVGEPQTAWSHWIGQIGR